MARQVPPLCDFYPYRPVVKLDLLLPSDVRIMDQAISLIIEVIGDKSCPSDLEEIKLALHEALANAIVHGNGNSREKAVRVGVGVLKDGGLLIIVRDTGNGFDPGSLSDPGIGERQLQPRGRGIFLMKQLVDDVQFRFDAGTELRLLIRRSSPERPSVSANAGPLTAMAGSGK